MMLVKHISAFVAILVKREENIKKLEIPKSDTEWIGYVGLQGTDAPVELEMDVEPCTDESIIKLYHRSDLVSI